MQQNTFGRNQVLAEKYKKLYACKFRKQGYGEKALDDFELLGRLSEENLELEKHCCKYKIEAKFGELIGRHNLDRRITLLQDMQAIVEQTIRGYQQGLAEREKEQEHRHWVGANSNVYVYIQYQYRMMLFQLLHQLATNPKMVHLQDGDAIMNDARPQLSALDKHRLHIEALLAEYAEMDQ